jgi:xanthine/uracil permease
LNHSWYLSVDMQLFWLSPLLLYPRYGKKFIAAIPILVALSTSCRFAASYNNDFKAYTSLMDTAGILLHKKIIYIATQTRMGPWLLGVLLGYILISMEGKKVKINKVQTFPFEKSTTFHNVQHFRL